MLNNSEYYNLVMLPKRRPVSRPCSCSRGAARSRRVPGSNRSKPSASSRSRACKGKYSKDWLSTPLLTTILLAPLVTPWPLP